MLAYLCYVESSGWTVYYLEIVPVLSWLAALGCWRTLARLAPGVMAGQRQPSTIPRAAAAAILVVVATIPFVGSEVLGARQSIAAHTAYHRAFRDRVANLPSAKAIVFVRYGREHDPNTSLVGYAPDPANARAWIVYDRGDTNGTILDAAPDRAPYLFDEARDTLIAIHR